MSYSREHGVSRPPGVKSTRRETEEEAREKQARAVDLRRAGASFSEIAQALGYADQSGAKKAVEAAIRRHEFEATADMLKMDLARLDEYTKLATHRLRTSGDLNQIDRLMRIMEKKHWLLGVTPATLADTQPDGSSATKGGMNVVIASSERVFVRGMMQAVGMDPDSEEGQAYLKRQGLEDVEPANPAVKKEIEPPKKKKSLRKKKTPPTPQALASKEPATTTPASPSPIPPSTQGGAVIEGEIVERIHKDHVMREEAKRISVRPTAADEVALGVQVLDARRI
jgi:hypothetical protein